MTQHLQDHDKHHQECHKYTQHFQDEYRFELVKVLRAVLAALRRLHSIVHVLISAHGDFYSLLRPSEQPGKIFRPAPVSWR
jgi:hypothetical protein